MADANLWGPLVWDWILAAADNTSTITDPASKYHQLVDFCQMVVCFEYMLPCRHCRESFACMNRMFPVTSCLTSGMHPVYWTFFVHNAVNLKLGKTFFPMRSVVRKLNLVFFDSVACARMVYMITVWAVVHGTDAGRRGALKEWFRRVVRLSRRDPLLDAFSVEFADWNTRLDPIDYVDDLRERLARVLNGCASAPKSAREYTHHFEAMMPSTETELTGSRK